MPDAPRIVVFEDKDENFILLDEALRAELDHAFEITRYDGKRRLNGAKWSEAERWIRRDLLEPTPAILAVIDWDLSQFEHPAPQQYIRGIAEDQAIPTVLYQSDADANKKLDRLRKWQERRIAVEGSRTQVELAKICADVARGFHAIRQRVTKLADEPRLLDTLRDLLKPPTGAPLHLEQFAVGNQELLRVAEKGAGPDYQRFIATWIGYLIYNRILPFPGPILNQVAAAAYLAISKEEIKATDVQNQIKEARYAGPFAADGRWWVSGLDGFIAKVMKPDDKTIPTGRVALERVLNRRVAPAKCHEGENLDETAFLCVLTNDIVCRRHSVAPEAWIPQGADQCRIHTDEFDALRAWLGI